MSYCIPNSYQQPDDRNIDNLLSKYQHQQGDHIIGKKRKRKWETALKEKMPLIYFNAEMTTGITNHYLTPQTLGLDRLAAVIGANYLYPGKNNLVIDGGTCITYDYVDAEGKLFWRQYIAGLKYAL